MKVKWKEKKFWLQVGIGALLLIFFFGSLSTSAARKNEVTKKTEEVSSLTKEIGSLQKDIADKDQRIKELEDKVEQAKPWFEINEKERQRKIEEEKAKEEAEKEAAEKKAADEAAKKAAQEAEEKRQAEEELKKGYNTGITYDQLARTPDDFVGDKVKFSGKVIQVMEGDGTTQIRLAVNKNYDTVLYGEFDSSIVKSRVLEDDLITVMGLSSGLLTYQSTMGGNISIPGVLIEKIEQ